MAILREYYEKDFEHTIRFHVTLPYEGADCTNKGIHVGSGSP